MTLGPDEALEVVCIVRRCGLGAAEAEKLAMWVCEGERRLEIAKRAVEFRTGSMSIERLLGTCQQIEEATRQVLLLTGASPTLDVSASGHPPARAPRAARAKAAPKTAT